MRVKKEIRKIPLKAKANSDIDHILVTSKGIFAITVTGKRYFNIKDIGLTKEDIEARYGISIN